MKDLCRDRFGERTEILRFTQNDKRRLWFQNDNYGITTTTGSAGGGGSGAGATAVSTGVGSTAGVGSVTGATSTATGTSVGMTDRGGVDEPDRDSSLAFRMTVGTEAGVSLLVIGNW